MCTPTPPCAAFTPPQASSNYGKASKWSHGEARRGGSVERVREYLAGIGYPVDPSALIEKEGQRLSTLCYLNDGERLLMLRRRKEPFSMHWTAPGGKIEPGETPEEAIVREMHEETGLSVRDLS